jgi:signal transduction histidine kinase
MLVLVWRFTRPIHQLSEAAERVASGDLDFRVDIHRRDEMGQLATTFNEMIGGLKAKSELEERLNTAERAAVIGRLASAVAHEIRNPLNFINLSIDHVRSKYAPEGERDRERFDRLLGSIKEEIARLNRLVNDVLNFGRPANLNNRAFDLRATVDPVLALVRAQADQQGIEIETQLPEKPVMVAADAEKLKSCFSNIVINAIQAMPDGGLLSIDMREDAERVVVRFVDTGPGIPEDALDRVFEPYYSTKDTGTGLGLAVTRKIVDEHGGQIRVESTPGDGTTFEVELPRQVAAADAGREQLSVVGTD